MKDDRFILHLLAFFTAGKYRDNTAHSMRRIPFSSPIPVAGMVALWLLTLIGAQIWMLRLENTPEKTLAAPAKWPGAAPISTSPKWQLVMLAHPRCPCTRASLVELERVARRCGGRLQTRILFFKPSKFAANWEKTDLFRRAQLIPGATLVSDLDGAQARHFHLSVSGQTSLFDASGTLRFSGGLTASRGEIGDNPGASAVISLVESGRAPRAIAPVFGCVVIDSSTQTGAETAKIAIS